MSLDFYTTLWVAKSASEAEIKKAYRKKAMKYHPDKNKGDAGAEKKFKEINEAYQTLSNEGKRKQYDMFDSAWWAAWNPFSWWWRWQSWWFEDIFWWMWWARQQQSSQGFNFNMEDLFWWQQQQQRQEAQPKKKTVSLDFEKIYEVPIFDLILWCSIEIRWVYGQTKKIKIPAGTKPWTKMRVKGFGKSEGAKKGNLLIKIDAKMPKSISDVDKSMLERIREGVGY